ncbi:MAG: gamma-glutamyltransferase [Candidatus Poriferisodalaceae bacterium]|nr:MAG: gamma-glutamyltransferase [Acidimicrobiales bacterium MED-G01]
MVVAAQPEAVEAGVVVLRAGGNAVDAAIACGLVAGVVDPQMCGIAGFGNLQVYLPAEGIHECIDFHAKSPLGTRADQWADIIIGETRDGFGFVLEGSVNDVGYQSIAAPGSLKAYFEAQTTWGVKDWTEVVYPAVEWAEKGFVVRPHVAGWWAEGATMGRADNVERLRQSTTGRDIYFRPDGSLKRVGDRVANPDLANTLRLIAAEGADVFYTGQLASRIAEDMEAHGGMLNERDLAEYRTTRNKPIQTTYRGLDVTTNHPPGGGVMVIEMLNILENFDLTSMGHNSVEYVRTVTEAMKRATSDKDSFVGDPGHFDVPLDWLISKDHAKEHAGMIRSGQRASVERMAYEPRDTTHVCVVDKDGNAASMTHSLGMPSGVITDGLGFMYNGCMAVFDPRPGNADSLAPGKSRFSSLCPTMVFDEDQLTYVVGAPGGTQIAMGVTQVLLNSIDFDMNMLEAVSAPRVSGTSDAIDVANGVPWSVTDALEAEGYEVIRSPQTHDFAWVHGIRINGEGIDGGADPAADGVVQRA